MTIGIARGAIPNYRLPEQDPIRFAAVGRCIYCGAVDGKLTDEHIVPFAAGGRWVLPAASCRDCAKITATFEGQFARTILGPLRMLYEMPTRRPKERPEHLPLKVKYPGSVDWEIAYVARDICPFLVALPLYAMPELMTGIVSGDRGPATKTFWIRGGGSWPDKDAHMEWLCKMLGATHIMPIATTDVVPWCLAIAKIAHCFAVARLGVEGFEPLIGRRIIAGDLSTRAEFLGGGSGDEPPASPLHEVGFDSSVPAGSDLVVVRVRLFAVLGLPTYTVVVGHKATSG